MVQYHTGTNTHQIHHKAHEGVLFLSIHKLDQLLQNQFTLALIIDSFSLTAPCLKDALTYHIILGPILSRAQLNSSVTFLPSWLRPYEPGAPRA